MPLSRPRCVVIDGEATPLKKSSKSSFGAADAFFFNVVVVAVAVVVVDDANDANAPNTSSSTARLLVAPRTFAVAFVDPKNASRSSPDAAPRLIPLPVAVAVAAAAAPTPRSPTPLAFLAFIPLSVAFAPPRAPPREISNKSTPPRIKSSTYDDDDDDALVDGVDGVLPTDARRPSSPPIDAMATPTPTTQRRVVWTPLGDASSSSAIP